MFCIEATDAEAVNECLDLFFRIIREKTRATLAMKKVLAANLLVQAYSFLCELEGPVRSDEIQTIFETDNNIKIATCEEDIRASVDGYISGVLDYLRTVRFQKNEAMISRAIGYVKTNYMRNIGTADAAKYVGLDPDYFGNIFHRHAGTTFLRFLAGFRVSIAQDMLRSPDTKIADISGRCGFTDPKYFARVFKSVIGETPSEYRRRLL
jgi:two-component system response regulator YesN